VKLADQVLFAVIALSRHRLRTVLSTLGVAIGVAAVVLLTSLGEGARRYVDAQFRSLGTNLLIVIPGHTDTTGGMPGVGGTPNDLTLKDAEEILHTVRQAELVVPISLGSETVANHERKKQVYVIGGTSDFIAARKLDLFRGSNLPELDWDRGASVIVLGRELAEDLFPGEEAVGGVVRVGDVRVRVIGVLRQEGTQLGLDVGQMALVPVTTAMRMYNESGLFRILIQVGAHADMEAAKSQVKTILIERHGEEDFTCITQDSVSGTLSAILGVLTLALAAIAGVSLSVAGIGIMNVMLVSVSERTSEVGLLRALGARRGSVRAVFLCEAALISFAGGALGLGLAWGATRGLRWYFPSFEVVPPLWAVIAALVVSVGVGLVFGVLPASQATRLDPVAALGRK
jgi:putative ABC transport system permease protein